MGRAQEGIRLTEGAVCGILLAIWRGMASAIGPCAYTTGLGGGPCAGLPGCGPGKAGGWGRADGLK